MLEDDPELEEEGALLVDVLVVVVLVVIVLVVLVVVVDDYSMF